MNAGVFFQNSVFQIEDKLRHKPTRKFKIFYLIELNFICICIFYIFRQKVDSFRKFHSFSNLKRNSFFRLNAFLFDILCCSIESFQVALKLKQLIEIHWFHKNWLFGKEKRYAISNFGLHFSNHP